MRTRHSFLIYRAIAGMLVFFSNGFFLLHRGCTCNSTIARIVFASSVVILFTSRFSFCARFVGRLLFGCVVCVRSCQLARHVPWCQSSSEQGKSGNRQKANVKFVARKQTIIEILVYVPRRNAGVWCARKSFPRHYFHGTHWNVKYKQSFAKMFDLCSQ